MTTRKTNFFFLDELYALRSFHRLILLDLGIKSFRQPTLSISKPLSLPSRETFRTHGLDTEQLLAVLPIVPASISHLLLHDVCHLVSGPDSLYPAQFKSALSRFEDLIRFHFTAPAEDTHRICRPRLYRDILQAFLPTLTKLETLEVVHPLLLFPSSFFVTITTSLPRLKVFSLLTSKLRWSHLCQMAASKPQQLGVSPRLIMDLPIQSVETSLDPNPSDTPSSRPFDTPLPLASTYPSIKSTISSPALAPASSYPSIFHSLLAFGLCLRALPQPPAALPIKSVFNDEALLVEHLPPSCRVMDLFFMEKWRKAHSPLWVFEQDYGRRIWMHQRVREGQGGVVL